jgi:SAM-dependent methyltransferase
VSAPGVCAACGASRLAPHFSVAGEAGAQGLAPTTDRFGVALSDIVRCAECGHMQLERMPEREVLELAYGEAQSSAYIEEEPGQRATARVALGSIERHLPPARLLDLGCWVGFLLDEARGHGWRVTGVEPSVFASGYARDRLGLDVHTADLFGLELEPGAFDAVVLADVLEHLPDPGRALDRIATLAKPEAILHLTLPDAGSRLARLLGPRWWSVIPTHVQYFTRHSVAVLLARHNWEVLEITTAPKAFTVRYYLERLAGYSALASNALVKLAEATGGAERLWAPDLRDRMAILARPRR